MAARVEVTVHLQTRYVGWAVFMVRLAKFARWLTGGDALSRFLYQACVFQYRIKTPRKLRTRWQWFRVPFPVEQKVSATYGG